MELIVTAVAAVVAEILVLRVFEKRNEKRWESYRTGEISDESFRQNIRSYDNKKGGEKE